jgi:hypothetical protein
MARATVKATIQTTLASGPVSDAVGATDQVTNVTTAQAGVADVDAAITAALADPTISGDPTALGLVETIETDFAVVSAPLALASAGLTGNVIVSFDSEVVLSRDQLRGAFAAIVDYAVGNGLVTP